MKAVGLQADTQQDTEERKLDFRQLMMNYVFFFFV